MAKDNKVHIYYGLIVLVVGLALVGAFIYYTNSNNQIKREQLQQTKDKEQKEQQAELSKKALIEFCLSEARNNYDNYWSSEVKRVGSRDNTLPQEVADNVEKSHTSAKDECYRNNQ
jgi:hypothetical protein